MGPDPGRRRGGGGSVGGSAWVLGWVGAWGHLLELQELVLKARRVHAPEAACL